MGCIGPLLLSPPRHGGKRVLAPLPAARPYPLPARHGHADSRGGSLRDGHARASPPVSGGSAGVDARSPVPSRDAEEKFDGVLDSAGRGSRSPTAAPQWEWDGEEVEGGDGEVHNSYEGFPFDTMDALEQVDGDVQSSYKDFPFDTMDALQEALPYRKGVSKFYNGKSGSFAKPPAAVIPSPPSVKGLPKPETPSPRKRKGLLPFSFKWGKAQNKEVYPEDDVVDSPMTCRRMTLSPVATSSSGSNSGSDDEAQKLPPRRPPRRSGSGTGVFAPRRTPRPPKLFRAHNGSQSMRELQDVTDLAAMVSPRDKRRKN